MKLPEIPGYEIECLLGTGGMGAVFMGRRSSDGLIVAIKIMKKIEGISKEMVARTKREIEMSKSLAHPYLIKILDGGTIPGRSDYFLVMEYLVGEDLFELTTDECLDEQRCRQIACHMAEALSYAHSLNLIHRDIKPANIFIESDGRTILLDFGLALASELTRLTATGDICGTFVYMAPEQLTGAQASPQSDIYSLGVTLYRSLTGLLPYDQDQLMSMCMGAKPPTPKSPKELKPSISQELSDIIMRCMALDPSLRFPSANALQKKLSGEDEAVTLTKEVEEHLSAAITPVEPEAHISSPQRRAPLVVTIIFLFVIVIFLLNHVLSSPPPRVVTAKPIGRAFTGDVEPLRDEIINHSWPPSSEDSAVLGEVLKGAGVLKRLNLEHAPQEAAALYYLATYLTKQGNRIKAAETFVLLVERFGPNILPDVYPPIVGTMLITCKGTKGSTELAQRMTAAANKEKGPKRDRLLYVALKAKVDSLSGKYNERHKLLPLRKEYEELLANKPEGMIWAELAVGYISLLMEQDTEEARDRSGQFAKDIVAVDELLPDKEKITVLLAAAGVLGGHYVSNEVKERKQRHLDKALTLTQKAFELANTIADSRVASIGIDLAGRYRALSDNTKGLAILHRTETRNTPRHIRCKFHATLSRFLADNKKYEEAHRQLRLANTFADTKREQASVADDMQKLIMEAAIQGVFLNKR